MDIEMVNKIYADIVNGVSKAESKYAKGAEGSALWDKITGEVAALRSTPHLIFGTVDETPPPVNLRALTPKSAQK